MKKNNNLRSKLAYGVVIFGLVSCSSSSSLVNVDGVKRVDLTQETYSKPQFFLTNYKPSSANRGIASAVSGHTPNQSHEQIEDGVKHSNKSARKLYFLSMVQQYNMFNSLLGKKSEKQNNCPQFHNDLVGNNKNFEDNGKFFSLSLNFAQIKKEPQNVMYYPAMSLPYQKVDLYSYLVKSVDWKNASNHVKSALEHYNIKNKKEIEELCQNGVSEGYFIYQNMVTYYGQNQSFHNSTEALSSVLKIPVVSNMLVLGSLVKPKFQTDHFAFYENKLLEKMNITWFKNYLYEVNTMRNNLKKRVIASE